MSSLSALSVTPIPVWKKSWGREDKAPAPEVLGTPQTLMSSEVGFFGEQFLGCDISRHLGNPHEQQFFCTHANLL